MSVFSYWNGDSYYTMTGEKIRVYKNMETDPVMEADFSYEEITGAVYAEGRLNISVNKGGSRVLLYKNEKQCDMIDLSSDFTFVQILHYLTDGEKDYYVMRVESRNHKGLRYILYDLDERRMLTEIPITSGLKDVQFYDADTLLLLLKSQSTTDDEMEYHIVLWEYIRQEELMQEVKWDHIQKYTGVYAHERMDGGYEVYEHSYMMCYPLFDCYFYHWPEELSVSAGGKLFLLYIDDFKGILVGNTEGKAEYFFTLPKEIGKRGHFLFDEKTKRLWIVYQRELFVYQLEQDQELINRVNEMYDEHRRLCKSLQFDFTFEELFQNALASAGLKLLCRHEMGVC